MNQLQNGGSLNLPYIQAFKLLKFSDWNVENRQNVILNNVDYLCKGIKGEVLRGNISEVVLSAAIKNANTVSICACVAELMIENAKNWSKMLISVQFSLETLL